MALIHNCAGFYIKEREGPPWITNMLPKTVSVVRGTPWTDPLSITRAAHVGGHRNSILLDAQSKDPTGSIHSSFC